ncbi:MOSC domain-containing protein [Lentzea sp. CC55]|uniref:MOSC domain-containing protein n=1 Tax=Lentzea sp. CC55 TaxID=2884909 RepID=UPI001F3DA485|nr:MOSC N-terminal beta barrel domain-containing protein [Lentzea sp. CC55]MCG8922659.1 MOSC domain-containing protein [Lentzea sp. CC55]
MHVEALWRYPVKSLGGEPLESAEFTSDGVAGDRLVHVQGPRGVLTGRTRYGLLTIPASTGPGGPLVDGHPWDSRQAHERVLPFGGRLTRYTGPERFDVLNVLVATDGQVAAAGVDVRRLRPNILIGGVEAGEEDSWPGHALVVGDVVIGMYRKRARCVVTTIDPDTGAQDLDVHRRIRREFGGVLCLDSWVVRAGVVNVGDPVEVVPTDELPERVGGWIVGWPYAV